MSGIYIHIPFCRKKCNYCSFHMSTRLDYIEKMIECEIRELILQRNYLKDDIIETIYFGGGTPSIIDKEYINDILTIIYKYYKVTNNPEITLECNPEDIIDIEKVRYYKEIGINRLSIGIQSFKKDTLKFLNRNDNVENIYKCIDNINKIGFTNYNLDLIFGIFNENFTDLEYNLNEIIKLKPTHISTYCLTIENNTLFNYKIKNKELKEIDDDILANQYLFIDDFLTKNNFIHYEISNYCLKNYESKHNCNYWNNNIKYLGVGPGAHSYNIDSRQYNIENNHIYINYILQNKIPAKVEILTDLNKLNEYIFTNIRTNKGLNLKYLQDNFNYKIDQIFINELINNNYIKIVDNNIILTPQGMFISDSIIEQLFNQD